MPIFSARRIGSVFAIASLITFSFLSVSCYTTKHYTYLQGSFDTASLSKVKAIDPIIRIGDILSIIVYSDNPEATVLYNQALSGAMTVGTSSEGPPGYLVDEKGNIEMQGVGLLHVEGLNQKALRDSLDGRLKDIYLKNPYYFIRFMNYKFTILGEVTKPGQISIPGIKINMFEALGLAGDMTFYGRRDNVLVIRENNGVREFGRMDLTKPEVMKSPYYYLQQNDIVIVEQNKKKIAANDQTLIRNVSLATTVISFIILIYTVFR